MLKSSIVPFDNVGLGITGSSLDLLNELNVRCSLSQPEITAYANLTNGNLVLFSPMVVEMRGNAPLCLGYIYNSAAPRGSNWHFSIRSLKNIPNPPYNSGQITLVEQDGRETPYIYSSEFGYYCSTFDSNSPRLSYDLANETWNWFDPKNGNKEQYNAEGLLQNFSDTAGSTLKYIYDSQNQLHSIIEPNGDRYDIRRLNNTVEIFFISVNDSGTKESLLQSYVFDDGILQKVIWGYMPNPAEPLVKKYFYDKNGVLQGVTEGCFSTISTPLQTSIFDKNGTPQETRRFTTQNEIKYVYDDGKYLISAIYNGERARMDFTYSLINGYKLARVDHRKENRVVDTICVDFTQSSNHGIQNDRYRLYHYSRCSKTAYDGTGVSVVYDYVSDEQAPQNSFV